MVSTWNERQVFVAALGLDGVARDEYLRRTCPDDSARTRIEVLLEHHAMAGDGLFASSSPVRDPALGPGGDALGDDADLETPERLGRFRILRRLGGGGMGVVHLAEDLELKRRVALKMLAPWFAEDADSLRRFRAEAELAASLNHPGIVPVYEIGQDLGRHFIISEYVDGETLKDAIDRWRADARRSVVPRGASWGVPRAGGTGPFAPGDGRHRWVADLFADVAESLEACHRAGVLHRDLKPSNVLLQPGRGPRLTDFGIAKRLTGDRPSAAQTTLLGTLHYLSPEQVSIERGEVDARSDVFGMGIALYESLCLRKPFDGPDTYSVLDAVLRCDPPPIESVDPLVPRDLATIVHTALAQDRLQRYQSAAQLAADLRAWLADRPILARRMSRLERCRRFVRRHRRRLALGAAVATFAGVAGFAGAAALSGVDDGARLSVMGPVDGSEVYVQPVDPTTFEVAQAAVRLGATPIEGARLEPGQYRVTVVAPDGGFAEWNALLFAEGTAALTTLRAFDGSTARTDPLGPREFGARVLAPAEASRGMMEIPAGVHAVGHGDDPGMPFRARQVSLPAFLIDEREVSNAEFDAFLTATGRTPPEHWQRLMANAALAHRPVQRVTLEDAEAYARWMGKRLPTMFEWEAAARFPDGRLHPWGAQAPPDLADLDVSCDWLRQLVSSDEAIRWRAYEELSLDVTAPDPLAGDGRLKHTFGNVGELTATIDVRLRAVVLKGRAYLHPIGSLDLRKEFEAPLATGSSMTGFRCARSAAPPAPAAQQPPTPQPSSDTPP